MSTITVVLLIVLVLAIAGALWMFWQRERSRRLRGKFGPEYDRVVTDAHGDRRRAEEILETRQKRLEKIPLRRLSAEERDRFAGAWRIEQERFVDDPRASVARADELVGEAMRARGFPVGDFEQRAADISVEHPRVVDHYRTAHDIAMRDRNGQASTEDLRRAMQHYRELFEHLLDSRVTEYEEVRK